MAKKHEADWGKFLARYTVVWTMIKDTLANLGTSVEEMVPWLAGDGKELFVQSLAVLGQEFAKFRQASIPQVVPEPRIFKIDRTQPFDPATFVGVGWTIWRGPIDGDGLEGDEDQDLKSLAFTEVDLAKVSFVTMLKPEGTYINGIERQKRLKEVGHIRLDAKVFQTFWENRELIPEIHKRMPDGNVRYMCFDGTVLRSPGGRRHVLCLYFRDGKWSWHVDSLNDVFDVSNPSVVLAS